MRKDLRKLERGLGKIDSDLRHDLLTILVMPSDDRAVAIGKLYRHTATAPWAELLIDLEQDDFARALMLDAFRNPIRVRDWVRDWSGS